MLRLKSGDTVRAILSVSFLSCLMLTGCLDTARIKRAPLHPSDKDNQQASVPGVPFYIKVAQCKQETIWLQPYYILVLKKTVTQKFADEDAAKKADEACKTCKKACDNLAQADACKKCKNGPSVCQEAPTSKPPQI